MTVPKRQHFLPRAAYLRFFCIRGTEQLYFYRRGQSSKRVSIANVANRRYFYSFENLIGVGTVSVRPGLLRATIWKKRSDLLAQGDQVPARRDQIAHDPPDQFARSQSDHGAGSHVYEDRAVVVRKCDRPSGLHDN